MYVSFLFRLLFIIAVAHACAWPNLTVYYVLTSGSSCVIFPAGLSQHPRVRCAMSHSSLRIVAFSWILYPCVIFISASDWFILAIVTFLSVSHHQDIRYQKHFLRLRLPLVLKSFRSKFWEISSISLDEVIICLEKLYYSESFNLGHARVFW